MERPVEETALMPQDDRNELLKAGTNRTSVATSPSVCGTSVATDGGDAEQLAQNPAVHSKCSESKCNESRDGGGSQHISGELQPQNPSGQLSDGTQPETRTELTSKETLQERLGRALIMSESELFFLLEDDLNRVVTAEAVMAELKNLGEFTGEDSVASLSRTTDQIYKEHHGESPQDGKVTITTRRRFFAILVLMGMASEITGVIEEGLYDWDLPLSLDKSGPGCPRLGSESWLVRRKAFTDNEQVFRAEVDLLERLGKDHPHLLLPLVTYEYCGCYYLLFQWADGGNLDNFFQSHSRADQPPRDAKLSKWLASQFLGLSEALASLENCEPDLSAIDKSQYNPKTLLQTYGAHGNLKAQNILWFREDAGYGNSLGTFKISDFGLTSPYYLKFHSRLNPDTPPTYLYRAPSYDAIFKPNSHWDMWALGCILAELVTWYLMGGDAVTKFRNERINDFLSIDRSQRFCRETMKTPIDEHFNMLRSLPQCTDFLLDLINFADERLLQMSYHDRFQASELLEFADSINQKCQESSYCLERTYPFNGGQGTTLSEPTSGPVSPI
ncbi:hypothetical protein O1611_g5808 [Lasiodiplodia mahajangana]|uniref:Uncharacterized protein n=1 Tax=Lasiodiplodia mahajangana TaxID=1108764 RepID=A0ACC2JKS2_9PEZI|nr:hypothetical protein O1611_g5808 [Lasiodiplodia mahajangana]